MRIYKSCSDCSASVHLPDHSWGCITHSGVFGLDVLVVVVDTTIHLVNTFVSQLLDAGMNEWSINNRWEMRSMQCATHFGCGWLKNANCVIWKCTSVKFLLPHNNWNTMSDLLELLAAFKDGLGIIILVCVQLIGSSSTHIVRALWFLHGEGRKR